jgi:hypothetical protein
MINNLSAILVIDKKFKIDELQHNIVPAVEYCVGNCIVLQLTSKTMITSRNNLPHHPKHLFRIRISFHYSKSTCNVDQSPMYVNFELLGFLKKKSIFNKI